MGSFAARVTLVVIATAMATAGIAAEDDFPYRSFPLNLMKLVADSDVLYNIHGDAGEDSENLLAAEIVRFSSGIQLDGSERIRCDRILKRAREKPAGVDRTALETLLLCSLPEDDAHSVVVEQADALSLEMREIDFRPRATLVFGDAVDVYAEGPWLAYALAKAAWRREPDLRAKVASKDPGERPSFSEELYALAVLSGAYLNAQDTTEEEAESAPRVESLDRLVDAVRADLFRGYALYEVLHKAYGIPLDALDPPDAKKVRAYLRRFVLVPRAEGDGE
jgi:hypothetical protein